MNNRIDGYCYDAAGNLLKEAACPLDMSTIKYKYDAENRMIAAPIWPLEGFASCVTSNPARLRAAATMLAEPAQASSGGNCA